MADDVTVSDAAIGDFRIRKRGGGSSARWSRGHSTQAAGRRSAHGACGYEVDARARFDRDHGAGRPGLPEIYLGSVIPSPSGMEREEPSSGANFRYRRCRFC